MKALIMTVEQGDPALQNEIEKRNTELKEMARLHARHFAALNQPRPKGDSILHFIGEIKTGYEQLAAEVCRRMLPAAIFSEAKTEHELFRDKDAR